MAARVLVAVPMVMRWLVPLLILAFGAMLMYGAYRSSQDFDRDCAAAGGHEYQVSGGNTACLDRDGRIIEL